MVYIPEAPPTPMSERPTTSLSVSFAPSPVLPSTTTSTPQNPIITTTQHDAADPGPVPPPGTSQSRRRRLRTGTAQSQSQTQSQRPTTTTTTTTSTGRDRRIATRQGTAVSVVSNFSMDDGAEPPQEFFREGRDDEDGGGDYFDEDDEYDGYSDEDEDGKDGEVFAFARPGTAAPPPPGGMGMGIGEKQSEAGASGKETRKGTSPITTPGGTTLTNPRTFFGMPKPSDTPPGGHESMYGMWGGFGGGDGLLRPPPTVASSSGRPKTVAFSELGSSSGLGGGEGGGGGRHSPGLSHLNSPSSRTSGRTRLLSESATTPSPSELESGPHQRRSWRKGSENTFSFSNPNSSSYIGKSPRVHGRGAKSHSRGSGMFESRPPTALSHQHSFTSGYTTNSQADEDKSANNSKYDLSAGSSGGGTTLDYRMRSMDRLTTGISMTENGDGTEFNSRPTSPGAITSVSQFPGSATIPDGMTTKGDGKGNMAKNWDDGTQYTGFEEEYEDEEDSPFAEVRASVSNIDDPEMPVLTFRAWFIGLSFVIFGTACNTFFVFRNPAPKLVPLVFQMLAYPIGKILAYSLSIRVYKVPRWLGGGEFSFNPGPFNIKEHCLIVIMSNVSLTSVSALHAVVASNIYYNRNFSAGFLITMLLTTQLTGFGFAGVSRRFLVWPASVIWPYNLVIATNLNTFHAEDDQLDGTMTRFKFFMIAFGCAFAYYFFPGFIFTALSYFSWVCWIKPRNPVINQLFGVGSGLGMGILTFDWAQISYIGSPLQAPWWAEVNIGGGFILFYWILCPILYYSNVWYTAYLPMSTSSAVDRYGQPYNVSAVTGSDGKLDKAEYEKYSPVYIAVTFCMTFMVAFALSTAVIVHTVLYHGERIWKAARHVYSEKEDIHLKLMKNYPEVPDWWYAVMLVSMLVLGIISVEVFHAGLPVYALLLSILLPAIYFIPGGFIYAMTTSQLAINLLAELIPGYMMPNNAVANMLFKAYSVQSLYSALQLVQDMKLGHYMKVPPRANFIAQFVSVVVSCFTATAVKTILFAVVPDMCSDHQKNLLTCPYTEVYYTASVLWGLIGPEKLFSPGRMYHLQLYALLFGAIIPFPVWFYTRKYPQSILKHFSLPVILNGVLSIPPASGINYASWLFVGFIFQYYIRRNYFAWWSRYNYTLSAALDVGTITSGVVVFLVLGLPGASLDWIGNTIYQNTGDYNGVSYLQAPETGFGPTSWSL